MTGIKCLARRLIELGSNIRHRCHHNRCAARHEMNSFPLGITRRRTAIMQHIELKGGLAGKEIRDCSYWQVPMLTYYSAR
jgi:hypothetical protein